MTAPSRSGMSFLDRFLPVWIILAMVAGLLVNRVAPGVGAKLRDLESEAFRFLSHSAYW